MVTLEDDIQLIQEVRKLSNLYDPRKRGIAPRGEMVESWATIAEVLNITPLDAKNRWRNLRDKFVREKKRLITDGEESYGQRDPWPLLDDMSFLWSYVTHRNRRNRPKVKDEPHQHEHGQKLTPILPIPSPEWVDVQLEYDNSDDRTSHMDAGKTTNVDLDNPPLVVIEGKMNNTQVMKRVMSSTDHDDESTPSKLRNLLDQPLQYLQNESTDNIPDLSGTQSEATTSQRAAALHYLDEDELFCLSVARSLRRFSRQQKAFTKLQIQKLLYDVECEVLTSSPKDDESFN